MSAVIILRQTDLFSQSRISSGISVLIESHQKALEKNTKVIVKEVSKSVLKVIMMAKLEQILNLE